MHALRSRTVMYVDDVAGIRFEAEQKVVVSSDK
jgi:hypothetical protein